MKLDFKLDKWDAFLILTLFIFISLFIVPSLQAGYHDLQRTFLAFIIEMIFAIPVLLLNVRVLMPYFFVKNRVWWYFPVLVLIIAPLIFPYNALAGYLFGNNANNPFEHGYRIERIGIFIWMQLRHVTVMSLVLIIRRLVFARQSIEELEKEKKMFELNMLKSQINPHFYFNTLNNLYALALKKSDKTPDSILKLSSLMEYVIYDCAENLVTLRKEIEFIRNYVELEKLRYEHTAQIVFKVSGCSSERKIIPMVLIQFVENAFKHGLSKNPDGFVNIAIAITDSSVEVAIENSYIQALPRSQGIGIINTIKRLDSHYENRYALDITDNGSTYKVTLKINDADV